MSPKITYKQTLILVLLTATLTGCSVSPPDSAPDYSADPPDIEAGYYVENVETVTINVPRDQLLTWLEETELSEILTPTRGMPAVAQTVVLNGDSWGKVGDRRRIELADGHYAVETILSRSPERFSYQVWGFTNQAGQFASYATGEFTYQAQNDSTVVVWTYRFRPNSLIGRLPVWYFVRNSFQGFMKNGLANMKEKAEAALT
ncbi:MAG: SRPBCC family protein [Cyanobacteria bacterium J06606_4]